MSEKTVLEIGIYVAIVAFLLTIIALVDTVTKGEDINGMTPNTVTASEEI